MARLFFASSGSTDLPTVDQLRSLAGDGQKWWTTRDILVQFGKPYGTDEARQLGVLLKSTGYSQTRLKVGMKVKVLWLMGGNASDWGTYDDIRTHWVQMSRTGV